MVGNLLYSKSRVIFALIFIFSCQKAGENNFDNQVLSDKEELISKAFDFTVGPDSLRTSSAYQGEAPDFILPPDDTIENKGLSKDKNDKYNLAERAISDKDLSFLLKDTLMPYSRNKERIYKVLNTESFRANFKNISIDYVNLLHNLLEEEKPAKLDMSKVKSQYNYTIINDISDLPKNEKLIGVVSLTRPAFNKKRDKAVIYSQLKCEGECGGGMILFFEKKNMEWALIDQYVIWVA